MARSHRTGYQKSSSPEREQSLQVIGQIPVLGENVHGQGKIPEISSLSNSWNMGLGIVHVPAHQCGQIL